MGHEQSKTQQNHLWFVFQQSTLVLTTHLCLLSAAWLSPVPEIMVLLGAAAWPVLQCGGQPCFELWSQFEQDALMRSLWEFSQLYHTTSAITKNSPNYNYNPNLWQHTFKTWPYFTRCPYLLDHVSSAEMFCTSEACCTHSCKYLLLALLESRPAGAYVCCCMPPRVKLMHSVTIRQSGASLPIYTRKKLYTGRSEGEISTRKGMCCVRALCHLRESHTRCMRVGSQHTHTPGRANVSTGETHQGRKMTQTGSVKQSMRHMGGNLQNKTLNYDNLQLDFDHHNVWILFIFSLIALVISRFEFIILI